MTLAIETLQLVAKRGVFEADDIINNTLGAVVGYGLFYLGAGIVDRCRRTNHYKLKKALLFQIPFVVAVVLFCAVFSVYDPYRQTDVISEKKAYETLCSGKFRCYDWQDINEMKVTNVRIAYSADSKGFYRPVYVFTVQTDAADGLEITISCEK